MKTKPYLTAIHRAKISLPLKTTLPFLKEKDKILDYGCGYGFDVKYLKENNYLANGYDKYISSKYNNMEYEKYDGYLVVGDTGIDEKDDIYPFVFPDQKSAILFINFSSIL